MWTVLAVVAGVIVAYGGICLLAARFQKHLIYMPIRMPDEDLREMAEKVRLEAWAGVEGQRAGWRMRVPQSRPHRRVLICHGNAGNAIHRLHFVESFLCRPDGDNWEVFLMEYPGYGAREGEPGEEAFLLAVEDALERLWEESPSPVLLLGESIGGALVCLAAARHSRHVAGLLLVTPVSTLTEVAAHHYPFFPVRRLLRERYDAVEAVAAFPGPVAMLLAERDEIVPLALSRRLLERHPGPHREWVVAGATHNTIWFSSEAAWWNEAVGFILARMEQKEGGKL